MTANSEREMLVPHFFYYNGTNGFYGRDNEKRGDNHAYYRADDVDAELTSLRSSLSRKDEEIEGLRTALQAIIDNRPQIVMNGFAKVGDDNAVSWNVHNIARMALAQAEGRQEVGK